MTSLSGEAFIDDQKMSSFQLRTLFLCFLIVERLSGVRFGFRQRHDRRLTILRSRGRDGPFRRLGNELGAVGLEHLVTAGVRQNHQFERGSPGSVAAE